MAEGEEVDVGDLDAAPEPEKAAASEETGEVRTIVVKEDLRPDKWMLRRNWMRLGWMAFIVGFIFLWVWVGYEMQWGAGLVIAVLLLETPFFLIALWAYYGIIRKRKRSRTVRVRKVAA